MTLIRLFFSLTLNENFKPEELVSSPAYLDDLKFMNSIISGKINGFEDQLDVMLF